MTSITLTEAEIFAAADAVNGRGEAPTVRKVRTELGRGSFSTIGEVLKKYTPISSTVEAEELPMPESIRDLAETMIVRVWATAQNLAAAETAAQRQLFESYKADSEAKAENEAAETKAIIEELENEMAANEEKAAFAMEQMKQAASAREQALIEKVQMLEAERDRLAKLLLDKDDMMRVLNNVIAEKEKPKRANPKANDEAENQHQGSGDHP